MILYLRRREEILGMGMGMEGTSSLENWLGVGKEITPSLENGNGKGELFQLFDIPHSQPLFPPSREH